MRATHSRLPMVFLALAVGALSRVHRPLLRTARSGALCMSSKPDAVSAIVGDLGNLVARHKQTPLRLEELCVALENTATRARELLDADSPKKAAEQMTVVELRAELKALALPASGRKAELLERLLQVRGVTAASDEPAGPAAVAGATAAPVEDPSRHPAPLQAALAKVVSKYGAAGPQTGIFCDGSCSPNPGPGGWGAVAVGEGRVRWSRHAHSARQTTNNEMELTAIVTALGMVAEDEQVTIYSDSNLCVNTLNEWAPKWERAGWLKANGKAPANLELVKEAVRLARERPGVRFEWIRGHSGSVWNEYADCLASSWLRM